MRLSGHNFPDEFWWNVFVMGFPPHDEIVSTIYFLNVFLCVADKNVPEIERNGRHMHAQVQTVVSSFSLSFGLTKWFKVFSVLFSSGVHHVIFAISIKFRTLL